MIIPSARDLVREALQENPNVDVNALHEKTFALMVSYRSNYYEGKVDSFLSTLDLEPELRNRIKTKMLEPVVVEEKEYSNFMEEASRRVSQSFQPISGSIAELCAGRELDRAGLVNNVHYTRRKKRTDVIVYHPDIHSARSRHRVEVKNVKIRERATRGLVFDGDSLFGFFDDPLEFTESNVQVIDDFCRKSGGFCYIPPSTLTRMEYRGERFRPNTRFGRDMLYFANNGRIPSS